MKTITTIMVSYIINIKIFIIDEFINSDLQRKLQQEEDERLAREYIESNKDVNVDVNNDDEVARRIQMEHDEEIARRYKYKILILTRLMEENPNQQSPAAMYSNQNLGEMDDDLRMALELSKTIK
jgi:hypothetical protein